MTVSDCIVSIVPTGHMAITTGENTLSEPRHHTCSVVLRRRTLPFVTRLLVLLIGTTGTVASWAVDPDYHLKGGGAVTVDPDTNRATVTRDGVTAPLWDGTHRLEDGSILIIRRGTSVPREPMAEPRHIPETEVGKWEGAPIVGYSPCERLVQRSCGPGNECLELEGCNLARQLLTMEQEERTASADPNRMTYTSGQCQEVEQDYQLFPYCR